ncbi:complex I subunit 4 family protein [Buchnera aphidicola]|uniref:NADH-quinone oxidoreductase subunit M n=1 Tax=Buchnera aphidicola (Cinara strobi) TaxID=1921549 RepID=A0A3B1DKZ7_9GAMM|nr:NADH-quinone oxidoreductase subunit M [Buchnera aphidicola]VAX76391.1 NADH-quinone oxidoreductase subunit M [Buchnera aphidicola (Cinara strobi)]
MILLIFILTPVFGAVLSYLISYVKNTFPRYVAFCSIFFCFVLSLFFYFNNFYFTKIVASSVNLYSIFYCNWFPEYGISFYFGIDKLSWCMIFLTSILGLVAIFCEWNSVHDHSGMFYFFLLLVIAGIFGIFLSFDMIIFFLFWEMILIPIYFLIFFWGNFHRNKNYVYFSANKFFIYSQLSGFILLFSILSLSCIYHNYSGIWTFNYFILKNIILSDRIEVFLMFSILLAFVIKIPLVPFHSWMPDLQECLPFSNSVDLIIILLKPAIYGLLRFNLVFFPHSLHKFSLFLMCWGLFSMWYGSIMAFSQSNLKRLIAFSSISSMGIIFSALHSENIFAYQGMIIYLLSYMISTTALLILINKIFKHMKTHNIRHIRGLWSCMQFIPSFFLFFSFANLNIPITGNFSGEFMMFYGIFSSFPIISCLFIFGLIFSSIYSLMMIQRVCYGTTNHCVVKNELTVFDIILLTFFTILLIALGLNPNFILQFSHDISEKLYQNYIFLITR